MTIKTQLWMLVCLIALAGVARGETNEPGKLRFVVIVTRHGVRSPTGKTAQLNQYSSQPWPNWDVAPGYLTAQGARLMTGFGGYYRANLAKQGLLEASGCADAVHVSFYSDSDQRTVETGKALAAGMFPGCAAPERSDQHVEGESGPLFHPLAAGIGHPDHDRAAASIAGRIGENPAALTEVYRPQLQTLQRILVPPGQTAAKTLLDIPAKQDAASGDHLAELKGPLFTASTMTENFLFEYATGLPMDQVGWGRVDLATLKQLLELHTAASDLTRRTPYLAAAQASNVLAHILETLQQVVTGRPEPGALGKPSDKVLVLVGHDTNLSNIAGVLNLNWLMDGRRDDTPPGGAFVFELRQLPDGSYQVGVRYTAQTLEQMRNVTPLTLDMPPASANIFIPGCSGAATGFPCDWKAFAQTVKTAIDPAFVK